MIEVRNLTVRYPGAATNALEDISLEISDGAFVAVMGGNGSGKSTLARCLNGLIRPASGEVAVDRWKTSDEESCRFVRRSVGMVFQNPHLQITSVTVEREIAFGLQNIGIEPAEIHTRVDEQLAASGLERLRGRPPRTLSGGEQQRLALAAVLSMRPAHLVLDEATSLLSPSSRNGLLRKVSEERTMRGMTVVLITQFSGEALRAGRLIVLHAGRVALDGEPATVLAQCAALSGINVPVPLRIHVGLPG